MQSKSLLKRVLVAGCGYIGEALADSLHESGWDVVALTHSRHSAQMLHARKPYPVRSTPVDSAEALRELVETEGEFDVAVHCASSGRGGGIESYQRVYHDGCRNLVEIVHPELVLYTSSTSVYPHVDGEIVDESTPACPGAETGRILREAEQVVLAAGGIVMRLAGIYGPGRSVLLRSFLEGKAVIDFRQASPSTPEGRWINQVHRADVVAALVHVLRQRDKWKGEIFNLCDSRPMTQRALYQVLARRFSKPLPPTLALPADLSTRKRGWTNKRVSSLKLQGTGWQPRFGSYPDALERDAALIPSVLEQLAETAEILTSPSEMLPLPADFPCGDYLFVFDKDGVLFNSEPIKLAAFESLFEEFPEHFDAVCAYNRSNVGAPRPDKLAFIFHHIFGLDGDELANKIEEYLERAAQLVGTLLPAAPMTPGLENFLRHARCKKYVCSAAPPEEVSEQLNYHGIRRLFDAVYAHPHRKADVLRELGARSGKRVIFWGDTIRDYQAALQAEVQFIGVERYDKADVFVGLGVPVIADFASGGGLDQLPPDAGWRPGGVAVRRP